MMTQYRERSGGQLLLDAESEVSEEPLNLGKTLWTRSPSKGLSSWPRGLLGSRKRNVFAASQRAVGRVTMSDGMARLCSKAKHFHFQSGNGKLCFFGNRRQSSAPLRPVPKAIAASTFLHV